MMMMKKDLQRRDGKLFMPVFSLFCVSFFWLKVPSWHEQQNIAYVQKQQVQNVFGGGLGM